LTWFNDRPARECYYSLHNLARTGTFLDKKIGEWFGPSTAAYVLRFVPTGPRSWFGTVAPGLMAPRGNS